MTINRERFTTYSPLSHVLTTRTIAGWDRATAGFPSAAPGCKGTTERALQSGCRPRKDLFSYSASSSFYAQESGHFADIVVVIAPPFVVRNQSWTDVGISKE